MVEQLKREFHIALMQIFERFGLVQRARVAVRPSQRPIDRQMRSRR